MSLQKVLQTNSDDKEVALSWFVFPLLLKPLHFPVEPLEGEICAGAKIYTQGKGIDRLYREDRQAIGLWFDGKTRREADQVIWLSPSLISRWLGYLDSKEKWSAGELESRWKYLRKQLDGRFNFVVRLCSLPRIDVLEGEAEDSPDRTEATDIRFLLTSNSKPIPEPSRTQEFFGFRIPLKTEAFEMRASAAELRWSPRCCLLDVKQSRDRDEVFREDWWLRVPFGEGLRPEFSKLPAGFTYPLGAYFSATYFVSAPISDQSISSTFALRVFSPKRERVAEFSLARR